jgi:hypothetical protein
VLTTGSWLLLPAVVGGHGSSSAAWLSRPRGFGRLVRIERLRVGLQRG